MKKRPTISDVAHAAGVSMMSVSRAVNNKPGLSEETRQEILRIADEIGYRPSQIARSLATRHTSTIGLMIPDVANPFFAQIARGAEDAAYENDYNVFLINTAEDLEREKTALDSLWQKEIDGAILCSPRLSLEALKPYFSRFPVTVLVNRELDSPIPNVATINVDDALGTQKAVEHLVDTGRKRIALIAGPETSVSSQRRRDGYRLGLDTAQRIFDPVLIESCPPTTDGGHDAALKLFSRAPSVDAIICFNDLVAVGAMQTCAETGWNVPTDIAVIGADNIPLASLLRPALTTLHVDQYEIGHQASSLIMEYLDKGKLHQPEIVLQPALIIRNSG